MKKKEPLTPVQIAIEAFEDYYLKDGEMEKRMATFIATRDANRKLLDQLKVKIESRQNDINNLDTIIAHRSMNGIAAPEMKHFYNDLITEAQELAGRYNSTMRECEKNLQLIDSYSNISEHKKMVAWIVISSLDPELGIAGYPKWSEKYGNKII